MPTIIQAQATSPISLLEAKEHLRITEYSIEQDEYINRLISVATRRVENDTQRSLMQRTLKLHLEDFPCEDFIRLEFPPLQSVTSIKYLDPYSVEQTLAGTVYGLSKLTNQKGKVFLKENQIWPETYYHPEAVTIEYVAGVNTAAEVQDELKQAILLLVSHLYERREMVISGTIIAEIPMNYEWLINPYIAW